MVRDGWPLRRLARRLIVRTETAHKKRIWANLLDVVTAG